MLPRSSPTPASSGIACCTLATAARESARLEREQAHAAQAGHAGHAAQAAQADVRERAEAQLATLRLQVAREVQALKRSHEEALREALAHKDGAFAREREAMRLQELTINSQAAISSLNDR